MIMYHIAVIEDDQRIRDILTDHFSRSGQVECVLAVDTVEKFLKYHRDFMDIHLILLDVMLYDQSSIPHIHAIRKKEPEAEIIMFTIMDDYDTVFQSLRNGATGYLLKELDMEELESRIVFALQGKGALLSPPVARRIIKHFNPANPNQAEKPEEQLTEKEALVAHLIKEGCSYESIARHLGITIDGVRYHVKKIYRKLEVKNRIELTRKNV